MSVLADRPHITRTATISRDGLYRYDLTRTWDSSKAACAFLMLNPSTADHENDDPTIVRCMGYAQTWGYGALIVRNLFAYRATDPRQLRKVDVDIIGPENDTWLRRLRPDAELIVCAWGLDGALYSRGRKVRAMLENAGIGPLNILRLSRNGYPVHPLYQPKLLAPAPWVTG